MIATHGDGVHYELASLLVAWSTVGNVVWVMFCSEVVSKLVSGHQVCLLHVNQQHNERIFE